MMKEKRMKTIVPGEIPTRDFHQYLLGCVAPRPIAWVSTVDTDGNKNLAPYSFFNVFSSNPPVAIFSSNRRVSNNTTKDTLHNVQSTMEAVINVVSYDNVRQMAVTSVEWDSDESEFEGANLTPIPSEVVKPFRVAESPAQLECKVREIITLGDHGGAGHLVICDILRIHIDENVIDNGRINPHKIDLMGRMGRAYYARASGDAIHTIVQAVTEKVIGYKALPEKIRKSEHLSANDIGILSGLTEIPDDNSIRERLSSKPEYERVLNLQASIKKVHGMISEALQKNDRKTAAALTFLKREE